MGGRPSAGSSTKYVVSAFRRTVDVVSAFRRTVVAGWLCLFSLVPLEGQRAPVDFEALPFAPRSYVCHRAPSPLAIDGKLDEPAWVSASWSDPFVDIEGDRRPRPR